MIGCITDREILFHPVITIGCFGWRVFFMALFQSQGRTFLSLLVESEVVGRHVPRLATMVDRCVQLELRAKRLYEMLAARFSDQPEASRFFATLAEQEQTHAELLGMCSQAARRGRWHAELPNPWERLVPGLEEHLDLIEGSLDEIVTLKDALQLVVQIESGEINRTFQAILASCDVPFVQKLAAFGRATEIHATYIADQIPKLDPGFLMDTDELLSVLPSYRRAG
jgi:hypothetical protein